MPKKGPPYDPNTADGTYVVIVCPWGVHPNSKERRTSDIDRLGAWVRFMLKEAKDSKFRQNTIVECVYMMTTRDEVIVQLPKGTTITPLLGEHRWAAITLNWKGSPEDPKASCIFEYNFRNNGDPANHNWTEYYPRPELPHGEKVPAKSPYPRPNWIELSKVGNIRNLILPIPIPPEPSPTPEPVYQPYEPPAHHPAHSIYPNDLMPEPEPEPEEPVKVEVEVKEEGIFIKPDPEEQEAEEKALLVQKGDPYEEENAAQLFLQSFEVKEEEDVKPFIKPEYTEESLAVREETHIPSDSHYRPSEELLASIALLQHRTESNVIENHDRPVKMEPVETRMPSNSGTYSSSGYQPSRALFDAFESLQGRNSLTEAPARHIADKPEPRHAVDPISPLRSTSQHNAVTRDPRLHPRSSIPKRREVVLTNDDAGRKRIKTEHS